MCVYINTDWCYNSVLISKSCSSLVEYAVVRCRPFYLLRELFSLHIVSVYIPPSANAEEALAVLYGPSVILKTNTQKDWLFLLGISTMQIRSPGGDMDRVFFISRVQLTISHMWLTISHAWLTISHVPVTITHMQLDACEIITHTREIVSKMQWHSGSNDWMKWTLWC